MSIRIDFPCCCAARKASRSKPRMLVAFTGNDNARAVAARARPINLRRIILVSHCGRSIVGSPVDAALINRMSSGIFRERMSGEDPGLFGYREARCRTKTRIAARISLKKTRRNGHVAIHVRDETDLRLGLFGDTPCIPVGVFQSERRQAYCLISSHFPSVPSTRSTVGGKLSHALASVTMARRGHDSQITPLQLNVFADRPCVR